MRSIISSVLGEAKAMARESRPKGLGNRRKSVDAVRGA
jgi:hypothetical protein